MDSRTTTFVDDAANLFTIAAPEGVPPDEYEETHRSFIADHWPDLAAASYMGFKRLGIGAVVVQERPSESDVADIDAHSLGYARAEGAWLDQRESDLPTTWLDKQFQTYDPNTASLLLFVEGEGAIRAYRAEGQPPPPEAFENTRSAMN